jgi:hypothetical protein
MKFLAFATTALTTGLTLGTGAIASAQSGTYYAGTAIGGQPVQVEIDSISRASYRRVNFVYYLGEERISAQANCSNRSWVTFPENERHYPQSRATERMVNFVCSRNPGYPASDGTQIVRVIDPPSNVRVSPNGRVICQVPTRMDIKVFDAVGSWYRTDACGPIGFIHRSQIRF